MFTALTTVAQQVMDLYNQAVGNYQESNDSTVLIEQAVTFLTSLKSALSLQAQAEIAARGATADALASAQSLYMQARTLYANLDTMYQTYPTLAPLVVYPSMFTDTKELNFVTMLMRHKARNYIEVAAGLTADPAIGLQYFSDALAGGQNYLSSAVSSYVSAAVEKISGAQNSIEQMLHTAQQTEDTLKNLPVSAWNSSDPHMYASSADAQWQGVLRAYALAWRTNNVQGYSALVAALAEYVQEYLARVPSQFYPEIGAALVYQALSFLTNEHKEEAGSAAAITSMQELIKSSFKRAQELLKIINSSTAATTLADSLEKLQDWVQRIEQSLTQQQENITSYILQGQPSVLLTKTVDSAGNTTYSLQRDGTSLTHITISNIDVLTAQSEQKLADSFFAQQQYVQAYPHYKQAQKLFEKLGQTDQATAMKNKYNIALTRATAQFYKNSIIPNDTDSHGIKMISIAGLSVPERFEFSQYSQKIPSYIPVAATIQQLARSQDATAMQAAIDSLLQYAYLLFVDNALRNYGIAYTDIFNGWQQLTTPNVTPDQVALVQNIVTQTYVFEQGLKLRVQSGLSSLSMKALKDAQGNEVFYVIEHYKPIPVLPLPGVDVTAVPYAAFPTVDNYYNAAQALVDPQKQTVQIQDKVYVSGNDPQFQLAVQQLRANAFVSAGNLYQQRVPFIMNNTPFTDPTQSAAEITTLQAMQKLVQQLKKVNKQDMNVQMSTFLPAYTLVKSYLHDIAMVYYDQAYYFYTQLNMSDKAKALNILKADVVVQLADNAQAFLVGDPRSTDYFWGSQGNYGGLLSEIKDLYMLAVALYQSAGMDSTKIAPLFSKGAQLFINAGDIVATQKNYPAAITYYGMAMGAYKGTPLVDLVQQNQVMLKWLNAAYKTATSNALTYRTALINPISIKLSNGQQESISLQDLITRGVAGDPTELAALSALKNSILDAFIYFRTCASAIELFMATDQNAQATFVQDGETIVKNFMNQNKIDVSSYDTVLAWFTRSDFEKTLQDFYDLVRQNILNADVQKQKSGYSALQQWCLLMYSSALSALYTHDFNQSVADLQQAIQFEQNEIIAPADQWIG